MEEVKKQKILLEDGGRQRTVDVFFRIFNLDIIE